MAYLDVKDKVGSIVRLQVNRKDMTGTWGTWWFRVEENGVYRAVKYTPCVTRTVGLTLEFKVKGPVLKKKLMTKWSSQ